MDDGRNVVSRPEMERPLKTREVGEYMGLSDRQVLRMVRNGQLPAKRVGNQYYFDPRKIARICGMGE
jgi:excisionase family DNA binding protein